MSSITVHTANGVLVPVIVELVDQAMSIKPADKLYGQLQEPDFGNLTATPGISRSSGEYPSPADFVAVYLPLLRFGCPTGLDPTNDNGMSPRVSDPQLRLGLPR